jgi:GntR family transcriptional regulator
MTSPETRQASAQLRAGTRANGIPSALYAKIRDHLRKRILDGRLKPHDQLPSESELIEQFDVSRITVRQALSDLQKEGLIFKLHGKGSFVSKPKADQRLASLQGFAEAMSAAGHEIYNRVASLRNVPAQATVADKLRLAPRSRVTEIRRVRFLNRSPISFEVTYIPSDIGARLAKADLETRDIFLILENDFGIRLGNADLAIEAGLADAQVARHLRIQRDAPVLKIERLTHTADRRPLDFEYLFFRGDAFRYRLSINRSRR